MPGDYVSSSGAATGALGSAGLLERLGKSLDAHGVPYCQWKGHWSTHRWATGRGDVDLLIEHDARAEFQKLASELGFKPALPPGERQIPGVESYFGHDPSISRLLHLHLHYRLVIGDYWTTTYRIPIERQMLDTAVPGSLFRVPTPTCQFLVFVLRMVLRRRGLPFSAARWRRGIQIQLDDLEGLSDREALATTLYSNLPTIDLPFFDCCVAALRGHAGLVESVALADHLRRRLRAFAHRPPLAALLDAAADKTLPTTLRRTICDERMRFAGGGTVIALVGGDGAGKTTCALELDEWLSPDFATLRAHLGNPPRSLLTLAVGAALKAEQAINRVLRRSVTPASPLELLRYVCTARDCHLLYQKASRFTARGGIAICERYPVPQVPSHLGPCIPELLPDNPSAVARWLQEAEARYYERILPPDTLLVLRLDPELAVLRKRGEPTDYVSARSQAMWEADWTGSRAYFVNTGRPLPEVLRDLKSLVWSVL